MALANIAFQVYVAVYVVAPLPRPPFASEVTFTTVTPQGKVTEREKLPCWHDKFIEERSKAGDKQKDEGHEVEPAELLVSLVVPAYNEEERIAPMLDEAVSFLNEQYAKSPETQTPNRRRKNAKASAASPSSEDAVTGWEILVVSDGSTDKTESTVLDFAQAHSGGSIRFIKLVSNRGKGGAVVHGMRHVRGKYVIFADADGASRFSDLKKLVEACEKAEDSRGCAVAIGSRAHLVGSEAVVSRSALRNFLMHSFHLLLWLLTPAATSRIRDTQCGFKLFSRASLPYIVPDMHSEGWIFDVEMLMLAERNNIPMVEVPIAWHEVKGSKLNVLRDSLGMAWGLAVLRAAWALGVYQTEVPPELPDFRMRQTKQITYGGFPKLY